MRSGIRIVLTRIGLWNTSGRPLAWDDLAWLRSLTTLPMVLKKLHAERQIVQVADRVVTRGGRRCVVLYAWEIPDRLGDEHIAHLVFVVENGDQVEARDHRLTFRPFTVSELRERLDLAGLREVDTDFDASRDRYSVVTVTA
jgi:hypothetical protein